MVFLWCQCAETPIRIINTKKTTMAEIYSIPDNNGSNGIPFSIPVGGFGGNGFGFGNGNGQTNLMDLLGFAIVASIFPNMFGGYGGFGGFGGGNGAAGFLSNQINNDSGRELIMQAVTNQGEASRTAISTLSTMLGQDFNLVNGAIQGVQNALNTIAANQGMNTLQVINAIQSGNSTLGAQFQQCCCQNQLAMANQTNALQNSINGVGQQVAAKAASDQLMNCQTKYDLTDGANRNTQAILSKLAEMQTQGLQDKLEAERDKNTALKGEISQLNQNQYIAGVVGQSLAPINGALAALNKEVDDIKCKLPNTINVEYPQVSVVNTTPYMGGFYGQGFFGGNGFGGNIVF